jgi:glycosyltransferase involved in cell wall biosynthesis
MVGKRPTGIANYALNLLPELHLPNLTALLPDTLTLAGVGNVVPIPSTMTPDQGKWGHLHRLWWTQFVLPKLSKSKPLLYSPVPEAPLNQGCRAVVMVHDLIPLRFPSRTSPLTYYARYYVPQVLRQAQHIVCNSEATARDVVDFYGIAATKLTPIPLAHNAQHFRPLQLPRTAPPYFLYVGRQDPYKNLQRLIQAFAALQNTTCQLYLAGATDPRFAPALHAQVHELGLGDRVRFIDYVPFDQLPVLMNQAIAMVFPSLWEGFGFPVLEAMACGTPVITSNLSSLPEVAGDAALLINPYRVDELTDAMTTLLHDDAARSHLSQAGRSRASHFSWAKTGAATREVLLRYL